MPIWQIFPYTVAVLEVLAAAVYVWHKDWRLAIVWGAVGVANFAFAGVR